MFGPQSFRRSVFVCACLALMAAPSRGQETGQRATLRVYLPADARLLVDGKPTRQTGAVRLFYSPPLDPAKSYHYDLECIYQKDGQSVTTKETVHFRAGDDKKVDLRDAGGRAKKGDEGNEAEVDLEVPFVPTPQDVVDKMLELAAIKKDDVVYDLGCGDGRIVVTAAKKYGCKAIGFDLDPKRIKESRANVQKNEVEKLATIERKDLYEVDLKPASVVTLYLLPEVNIKLIPQLAKLKAGSRIVSHDFEIRGYKPKQTVNMTSKDDLREHKIYLWETPLQKEKE